MLETWVSWVCGGDLPYLMLYQTKKRQRPWFKETLPKQGQRALEKECGQQAARAEGEESADCHDDNQSATTLCSLFDLIAIHVKLLSIPLRVDGLVLTNQRIEHIRVFCSERSLVLDET